MINSATKSRTCRRLIALAACLVLGFALSYVVAWAFIALRQAATPTNERFTDAAGKDLEFGPQRHRFLHCRQLGVSQYHFFGADTLFSGSGSVDLVNHRPPSSALAASATGSCSAGIHVTAGWPAKCVTMSQLLFRNRAEYRGCLVISRRTGMAGDTLLPYQPIPSGLIINTLFYATLLALPLPLYRHLRATLRRRRGHCPRCAYDLRADFQSGCPECAWNRQQADKHSPAPQTHP